MSKYVICTEQMTVGYDGKPLINNIGIKMKPGEIFTLIAFQRSGKVYDLEKHDKTT